MPIMAIKKTNIDVVKSDKEKYKNKYIETMSLEIVIRFGNKRKSLSFNKETFRIMRCD